MKPTNEELTEVEVKTGANKAVGDKIARDVARTAYKRKRYKLKLRK